MFDIAKAFDYENGFYLTSKTQRMARLLAHFELFNLSKNIDGNIVECGVFKGASFMRFTMFLQLFDQYNKRMIGFDTFGNFPTTEYDDDKEVLQGFIEETGGGISTSVEDLENYLGNKSFTNYELIKGDILETVPRYIKENPELKISLLNIDTDVYEPAKCIIEHLIPKVVKGGVIIFDDYNSFPGETVLADQYCNDHGYEIKQLPFSEFPSYIIKR